MEAFRGKWQADESAAPGGASGGNRVFGSVDVEHEFSADRKVVASGTELESNAAATWLRLGLNGSHTWDDGRYTVQGGELCDGRRREPRARRRGEPEGPVPSGKDDACRWPTVAEAA